MTEITNEQTIEEMYWDTLRQMSPAERLYRGIKLTNEIRAMLAFQIRSEQPELSNRALQFAVARRVYWDDVRFLKLLDEAEKQELSDV